MFTTYRRLLHPQALSTHVLRYTFSPILAHSLRTLVVSSEDLGVFVVPLAAKTGTQEIFASIATYAPL